MKIELIGTVRGEAAVVRWSDGALGGSAVLLDRLEPMLADGRCDRQELTSVVRWVEAVAGQRMTLRVLDDPTSRPGSAISAA
jgi:hypothetical protein